MGQALIAGALVRVAAPAALGCGFALLVAAAITGRIAPLVNAIVALTLGVVAFVQLRRHRPRPFPLLVLASLSLAVTLPVADRSVAAAALPSLAMFMYVGIFALPKSTARLYAVWCGLLGVWSIPWLYRDITLTEMSALILILGAVAMAGFHLLSRVNDTLIKEEENSRLLFDSSPVATWEEDFTAVDRWLKDLREAGVLDLRTYLLEHPDEVKQGASSVIVRRANPAAARMLNVSSTEHVVEAFGQSANRDANIESFTEQFVAIWEARGELGLDLNGFTADGERLEAVLHWSVPLRQGRPDLSRVIVTISDITPRRTVEERLAATLLANQQLLGFEHAIATCSQALLLGTGEDPLQLALETLRDAIAADSGYLFFKIADDEAGHAFRVVNAARKPTLPIDDPVGKVFHWTAWPAALETFSKGEPFVHIATGPADTSRLGVPIFTGDDWLGIIGFEDTSERIDWPKEAIKTVVIAAPMLGTYWERETTRQRLIELVQSKDRFVASVSHELRTPLSAVLGFAEELKHRADKYQPAELTEMLELIADQSQDMADMVEDLLVAARADIGTINIRLQDVYLRSQAEAVLTGLDTSHKDRVEVIGGPGKAWADPTRTRQIIRNLLSNAVRYGGSKVVAEAHSAGELTVLSVRDDGPGLPRSEWERIFEPYQRAHDRPTQPGSIGLGLTVSRQLARLMGGDVTYRSNESESIFELTLPAYQPADESELETLVELDAVADRVPLGLTV